MKLYWGVRNYYVPITYFGTKNLFFGLPQMVGKEGEVEYQGFRGL